MAARVSYLWVHPTFRGATCDQIGCTCFGNEPLKEMENLIHQEKQQVSTNKISDLNKNQNKKARPCYIFRTPQKASLHVWLWLW